MKHECPNCGCKFAEAILSDRPESPSLERELALANARIDYLMSPDSSSPEDAPRLALLGIERMLESVKQDLRKEDPGNHATIGFLNGEGKGLMAAKLLLESALRGHHGDHVSTMNVVKPREQE